MAKRFATAAELEAAPILPVALPPSSHASNPISGGSRPELYMEADLKKVAVTKHARSDEFEKRLIAIWWKANNPIPFIFRTSDGTLRSLDAGCVGFLLNRFPPDCDPITDPEGYVVAVIPRTQMDDRYQPIRQRLQTLIDPA
jgi:hypothetical protein